MTDFRGVEINVSQIGHHLMRNTGEPPLFHKVIIESGAATARAIYSSDHPLHEKQFHEFLALAGCKDVPEADIFTTLRSLPVSTILRASVSVFLSYDPSVRWPFQPVIDGDTIPTPPIDSLRGNNWHKVPILTGFNTNEGAAFIQVSVSKSEEFTDFFRTLNPRFSEDDLKILDKTYPDPAVDRSSKYLETRPRLGAQFKRLEQAYGHFAYVAPVRQTAHYAAAKVPTYLYHFAVSSGVSTGANHGDHAAFATYSPIVVKASKTVEEISRLMNAYWTSFILSGDPNAVKGRFPERPVWPAYVPGSGKVVIFGEGNDEIARGENKGTVVKVESDRWAAEECDYWWARSELSEG